MPVASRQSAGLPMYRRYTGTLPASTRPPPGHYRRHTGRCRSSAGACMGPGGATVPSRLFPVPSRLFPVLRRSLPALPGESRRYKTFKYFPGGAPVVPGLSRSLRWSPGSPR
ncbi:hypothetical protein DPMN_141647 [Dreissena polymorpha]|uniref:Uncharacterized protein n=1 Tax=Dreissena polymorpha TaxID=45954 RepID=A0A9D4GDW8_DREPO|nr:hypothetical protein DPMN_141647 [Dreissena polymorpha]